MTGTETRIIVLHGALGSADQMAPLAQAMEGLAPAEALELPGHGATESGDVPFTIAGFAAWLASHPWISDGGPRPVAFGYSMGGYIALALEARRPGTFAGILTLGTRFSWSPTSAAKEGAKLDPALIREKVPRFAAMLEERHAGSGGWEGVLADTAALLTALGAKPLLVPATLGAIRIPVTLSVGSADDTVTWAETNGIAEFIPGAESAVIDGAPHPIEKVPGERIVELMRAIIARAAG